MLRKSYLGPAIPTKCRKCGNTVGVSRKSMLGAFIPFFLGIVIALFVESRAVSVLIWGAGAVAMLIISLKWVPLVRR